jgi:Polyketide cyclase / dehydrase and lipid transport
MSSQTASAQTAHVLEVLTDPAACGRWAPIAFTTEHASGERLQAGTRTTLNGRIAGRSVSFDVEVLAADDRRLSLWASGPVGLEVDYRLTPAASGTLIDAQITLTQAAGITGAVLLRATAAMLSAGALRCALRAIAAEAEQLQHDHIERKTTNAPPGPQGANRRHRSLNRRDRRGTGARSRQATAPASLSGSEPVEQPRK